VREALFDILGPVAGMRVLDLFAGTGAVGIEALSRGGARAVFVERDREALRALRANLAALGVSRARARVVAGDALAAAGGAAGGRLRSADEIVAGRQIRIAMTETVARVELDQLAINTIRTLAMDAVQQADSGHSGTAMALARPVVSTRVSMIPEILDGCGAIVDVGELPGTPSTVLDLTGPEPVVLREGAVPAEEALARAREALGVGAGI